MIDHFRAEGAVIAVCTNKREQLSRQLLGELGLAPRFRAVAGRDTFAVCIPIISSAQSGLPEANPAAP